MPFLVPNAGPIPGSNSGDDDSKPPLEPLGPEFYGELEERLGYSFSDRTWLERAVTHRSVPIQPVESGDKSDYERLEFLGDAVLNLAVAHLLLDCHPEAREGELSKMRAALVNTTCLAEIARELNLSRFIRLSKGELASGGAERPSILADVVEAVLGAIYREAGYAAGQACVLKLLGERAKTVTPRDPKTELQEALHAVGHEAPMYKLECIEGPEHAPTFISIVEVEGRIFGRGRGTTKKASQQAAAAEALKEMPGRIPVTEACIAKAEEETDETTLSESAEDKAQVDSNEQ